MKNYVKTFENMFNSDDPIVYNESNFPAPGDSVKEILVHYTGDKAYIVFESGKKTMIKGELWQVVGEKAISDGFEIKGKLPEGKFIPYIVKDAEGLKLLLTTRDHRYKTIEDLIALGVDIKDGTYYGYPVRFQNQFLKDSMV